MSEFCCHLFVLKNLFKFEAFRDSLLRTDISYSGGGV